MAQLRFAERVVNYERAPSALNRPNLRQLAPNSFLLENKLQTLKVIGASCYDNVSSAAACAAAATTSTMMTIFLLDAERAGSAHCGPNVDNNNNFYWTLSERALLIAGEVYLPWHQTAQKRRACEEMFVKAHRR